MSDETDTMTLTIPVDTRHLRLARRAVARWGAAKGVGRESVDDLRIAVDELCTTVAELARRGDLTLDFEVRDHTVHVAGRAPVDPSARIDGGRYVLSERILRAVCDRHRLGVSRGVARFDLYKRAWGRP